MSDNSIHPAPSPIVIPHDLDDVDYAQSIRKQLVSKLLHGGQVPQDNKELNSLIKLLDGVSKTSLDKQKAAAETQNATTNTEVAKASIALMKRFGINNPYERTVVGGELSAGPTADLARLPEIETVPGEKDLIPRDWGRHNDSDEDD